MAAYLLDANIISYFLNTGLHGELGGCAAHVALEIVDEVREEIASHRTLGRMFARGYLRAQFEPVRSP